MKVEKYDLTNENVTLTAYILDDSPEMPHMKERPAMLVLPGGAYKFCSDREAEPMAMAFIARGYNAFVLRYSLNENSAFPRPLNDAEEALEMIIANAEQWHVDKSRIAAMGFSAGGHLCAALSTMGRVRPAASVLCYPCILEEMGSILAFPIPGLDKEVDEKTPPTFIVSSREDGAVPIINSIKYSEALTEKGIDFEMHIYNKGYHGFALANDVVYQNKKDADYNRHMEGWVELAAKWLERVFAD